MSNPFQTPEFTDSTSTRASVRLRRVGVLSVGLFGAAAGVLMGLIAGTMMLMMSLVGMGLGNGNNPNAAATLGVGLGMLIGAPIFYGIAGFLGGMLNAVIYNVVAGMSGGIEMEFTRG